MAHSLTEKNVTERTAECAECGPVKIYKKGSTFICATAQKARMREWAKKNPDAARANRARKGAHVLSERDAETLIATCSICGPTRMVPYGRGYACAVRTAELRQVVEDAPQARCAMCNRWPSAENPLTYGRCRECHADLQVQVDALMGLHTSTLAGWEVEHAETLPAGYHVVDDNDEAFWSEPDPAVTGWRTIGSNRPWSEA